MVERDSQRKKKILNSIPRRYTFWYKSFIHGPCILQSRTNFLVIWLWNSHTRVNLQRLKTFQHFVCGLFLRRPSGTRSDMSESFHELSTKNNKRKLLFLQILISLPVNSHLSESFHFSSTLVFSQGWPEICKILWQYKLSSFLTTFCPYFFQAKRAGGRIVRHTKVTNDFSTIECHFRLPMVQEHIRRI